MAKAKSDPLNTPMMKQYRATKAEHPDCLLFMRMGDFFELFLDDAKEAAKLLGITLTARNKGAENEVPMAGVPHHSLQQHLPKLLAAGKKVAIMDQLEDPSEAQGLVKRGLTRIITPGTLIDEEVLSDVSANFLVSVSGIEGPIGIAALDCSTGQFLVEEAANLKGVALALARLQPAELVLPTALAEKSNSFIQDMCDGAPPPLADMPAYAWAADDARRTLCERLNVNSLDGFDIGADEDHIVAAAAAALRYATDKAFNDLKHVRRLHRLRHGAHLVLDSSCRRNLDILKNARDGSRNGTLFSAVNRTRTAPGARLLSEWLTRPLATVDAINQRHESVGCFVSNDGLRTDVRDALREVYDLERLLTRIGTGRCNARDLVHLAGTLRAADVCREYLEQIEEPVPHILARAQQFLSPDPVLVAEIEAVLVDDPPLTIGDGGMVRDGVDTELDELRVIKRDASTWLAGYQAREAERCGIPKIKVGYNRVFGYYLEVSKAYAEKVPEDFIRKQTLVNAERFITPELKEYEDKALGAEDRIRSRELELFYTLRGKAEESLHSVQDCADALAQIDVLACLADVARRGDWCRPKLDNSTIIDIQEGRHPVIEQVIGREQFVANDCQLSGTGKRLGIITGPNMAGKSTYIRQVALAVILAQAGSFIPASSAHIGLVDRLFTRIGAGDELSRNMSTFMVEMAETAAILNNATDRSLVILDEVGRGTSTFDGVSLAWAITEYLHDKTQCRCYFATHYHELTDLADDRDGIFNVTVAVSEEDNDVVFLHRIVPGAAAKSYGIHVAQLAGVPNPVTVRANEVLSSLEQMNVSFAERERPVARQEQAVQLTLFEQAESPTLTKLKQLALDDLSPRDAQNVLYELYNEARSE